MAIPAEGDPSGAPQPAPVVVETPEQIAAREATEAAEAAKVAPVTVEALKLPDGFTPDETSMKSFVELLNNKDLSSAERAQGLIDLQTRLQTQASEAASEAWNTLQTTWQAEVKADPDVGGAKLQTSLASIGKLVQEYGTDDLRTVFDSTGAGNNVHVVKFLTKIAAKLTEGSHVSGDPAGMAADAASRMFPSMKGQ